MKIKLKGFFKITTITSYLRVTSKVALFGSLKGKVISNSSFTLTNLCVARNLEKKKPFVPRDKNDQTCNTALYIHGYILWFRYPLKFVQSQSLRSDTFA